MSSFKLFLILYAFVTFTVLTSWFVRANQTYTLCYAAETDFYIISEMEQVIADLAKIGIYIDDRCYFGDAKVYVLVTPALGYGHWAETASPAANLFPFFGTVPQRTTTVVVAIHPILLTQEPLIVRTVLMHEMGHVLGLAHSDEEDTESIMDPRPHPDSYENSVKEIDEKLRHFSNFITW